MKNKIGLKTRKVLSIGEGDLNANVEFNLCRIQFIIYFVLVILVF